MKTKLLIALLLFIIGAGTGYLLKAYDCSIQTNLNLQKVLISKILVGVTTKAQVQNLFSSYESSDSEMEPTKNSLCGSDITQKHYLLAPGYTQENALVVFFDSNQNVCDFQGYGIGL